MHPIRFRCPDTLCVPDMGGVNRIAVVYCLIAVHILSMNLWLKTPVRRGKRLLLRLLMAA